MEEKCLCNFSKIGQNALNFASKLEDGILDLIYPRQLYCLCCGKMIDKRRTYSICRECFDQINWENSKVMQGDNFDLVGCTRYGDKTRKLIFALKYNGNRLAGHIMGRLMAERLTSLEKLGEVKDINRYIIVPVPLAPNREAKRGFNQSLIMAEEVKRLLKIPVWDALYRRENTKALRGLSPAERFRVMKGAIAVKGGYRKKLQGQDVILIDDIYTTGATAKANTEVLREVGAGKIMVFTFSRR